MAQQILQTALLFDINLLISLSLRMATVSAMSLIPNIFIHSAAISELLMLKKFLAHDTTTYRVAQKFGTIILYALTLPNINRFEKL